jgi:putative oxidoreductase
MKTDDLGKLLLRLTLGGLMLFHGVGKITGDIGYIHRMLAANSLPDWLAYGVYIGEVLGPVLVILGWYSRVGAAFIAANMLFIFAYPHRADFFTLNRSGAWALELEAFYLLAAVAVMLVGPGRFSINRR